MGSNIFLITRSYTLEQGMRNSQYPKYCTILYQSYFEIIAIEKRFYYTCICITINVVQLFIRNKMYKSIIIFVTIVPL